MTLSKVLSMKGRYSPTAMTFAFVLIGILLFEQFQMYVGIYLRLCHPADGFHIQHPVSFWFTIVQFSWLRFGLQAFFLVMVTLKLFLQLKEEEIHERGRRGAHIVYPKPKHHYLGSK
jgi:hypothetical protein